MITKADIYGEGDIKTIVGTGNSELIQSINGGGLTAIDLCETFWFKAISGTISVADSIDLLNKLYSILEKVKGSELISTIHNGLLTLFEEIASDDEQLSESPRLTQFHNAINLILFETSYPDDEGGASSPFHESIPLETKLIILQSIFNISPSPFSLVYTVGGAGIGSIVTDPELINKFTELRTKVVEEILTNIDDGNTKAGFQKLFGLLDADKKPEVESKPVFKDQLQKLNTAIAAGQMDSIEFPTGPLTEDGATNLLTQAMFAAGQAVEAALQGAKEADFHYRLAVELGLPRESIPAPLASVLLEINSNEKMKKENPTLILQFYQLFTVNFAGLS